MNQQLKDLAKQMFEANPTVEMFFVSTDNQFFIPDGTNSAQAYQASLNGDSKNDQLIRVSKDMAFAEDKEPEEEVIPDASSMKEVIVQYLVSKGVEASVKEKKEDLLAKLASLTPSPSPEG